MLMPSGGVMCKKNAKARPTVSTINPITPRWLRTDIPTDIARICGNVYKQKLIK